MKVKFKQRRVNESIIQHELYARLRDEGIFAYPEYRCKVNGRVMRFDLAIFDDEENLAIIIECKSWAKMYEGRLEDESYSKQRMKYSSLGLPLIYCVNIEHIQIVVEKVKSLIQKDKKMVKVRTSQIPEDGETTKRPTKKEVKAKQSSYFPDRYEEDDEEDREEEPKKVICRVMIEFADTLLDVWQIGSISKVMEFKESTSEFEYGIVINAGFAPSQRYPITDLKCLYAKEKTRDERYRKLKDTLEQAGVLLLKIE